MYKILLDTNILIDSFKFKIRLLGELKRIIDFPFELYIVKGTLNELEKLIKEGKGSEKRAGGLALQFLEQNIKTLSFKGNVDDYIVKLAKKGYIIATSDKELKKRLKNYKIIILKQKKYLKLENVL